MINLFKFLLLTGVILSPFSVKANTISPQYYPSSFPGFSVNNSSIALTGYSYSLTRKKEVTFTTCKEVINYKQIKIPEFEYFRFRLLLTSCVAIQKYLTATSSDQSFLDQFLSSDSIKQYPAHALPFLSKHQFKQRRDKTLQQALKLTSIDTSKQKAKLLTKDDEVYIQPLARGDFDGDNIEDVLLQTTWYARNAFGKHVDLVLLTKKSAQAPFTLIWRYNQP